MRKSETGESFHRNEDQKAEWEAIQVIFEFAPAVGVWTN